MNESHERRPNRHCSRPYFSKREVRSAFEIVEPRFAVVAEMVSREVCAAIRTTNVVDWGREQTIRRGGRTMRLTRQTRLIVPSACGALSDDLRYPVETSQVRRCGVRHSRVAPLRKSGVRGTRNSYVTSNQQNGPTAGRHQFLITALCHLCWNRLFANRFPAETQGPESLKSTKVMPSPRTLRLCEKCSNFNTDGGEP